MLSNNKKGGRPNFNPGELDLLSVTGSLLLTLNALLGPLPVANHALNLALVSVYLS